MVEDKKIKVDVRKDENGKNFSTEELSFHVDYDLLDGKTQVNIKQIAKSLVKIFRKTNASKIFQIQYKYPILPFLSNLLPDKIQLT